MRFSVVPRSVPCAVLISMSCAVLVVVAATPSVPAAAGGVVVAAAPTAVALAEGGEPGPGAVPELSTQTSDTVLNADGSYTAEISAGPINFQQDDGDWVPISNEMVEAPGAYAVQNEANDYTVSIPENPALTPVRFELDGDWVTMKLAGSDDVEPDVSGSGVSFEGLTAAADEVAYEATDTGVKETITLASAPLSM